MNLTVSKQLFANLVDTKKEEKTITNLSLRCREAKYHVWQKHDELTWFLRRYQLAFSSINFGTGAKETIRRVNPMHIWSMVKG